MSTSAPHMRQSLPGGMQARQKKWPQGVFTASKNRPEHLQPLFLSECYVHGFSVYICAALVPNQRPYTEAYSLCAGHG